MIFFLWIRGFVAHSVVEKDSLLLEALNCIRRGDFDKARHDVLSERSFHDPLLGKELWERVVRNENIENGIVGETGRIIGHFQYYFRHMEEGSWFGGPVQSWERIAPFTNILKPNHNSIVSQECETYTLVTLKIQQSNSRFLFILEWMKDHARERKPPFMKIVVMWKKKIFAQNKGWDRQV